ncbi:hypothetical protein G4G28_21625 [Massilia sp. Dwa41.01b]|uniref:hypothetical protein n=1 Tax=unclassified Massilia TaxID=2609279 RepID=UPI0015FF8FBD|nr:MULTISPECIES: hypothetical protein [unclassified Massilia]QNA90445.1 hypothetical protein G4G28_21625 [Massilia sp. Dwa41.01b]QNA97676.1 hypothetical protein G4G31_00710 [Massilia sp. Se16.2.3]
MYKRFHRSSSACLACVLALAVQLTGCSGRDASSSADKQRIAELELELSQLKKAAATPSTANASASLSSASASAAAAPEQEAVPAPEVGKQWDYSVSEDKMTGGMTKFASVSSSNTVNFGFPYSGAQHGSLTLRTDPRHGKDVLFQISRGQILCPSYEGCSVQVRFDDEKPVTYHATGPADHSSETVFIQNYAGFLNKLKKAQRVRLSLNIYQQGSPVFEFDVSGFSVDRYQNKS